MSKWILQLHRSEHPCGTWHDVREKGSVWVQQWGGGKEGDWTLFFCRRSFVGDCFIFVFSFSICKAPSVCVKGGEASQKVDLEQLNWVSAWISLWRNSIRGVFLSALAIESLGWWPPQVVRLLWLIPLTMCGGNSSKCLVKSNVFYSSVFERKKPVFFVTLQYWRT